jgi:hypothetical protein
MRDSNDVIDRILESVYDGGYFDSEFETMNIINFLRMFFDKYEFSEYYDTHHITEKEYKRYFKDSVKFINPNIHKRVKKIYKINRGGLI